MTTARKEYVPVQSVNAELDDYLSLSPVIDYITFSGSGEPTLNSGIEIVTDFLKTYYPDYKISLLTNSTLLTNSIVRSALRKIDLIICSLDAASEDVFQQINRPHKDIKCVGTIEGLIKLRSEYSGKIILEIFIVPALNDTPEELALLKKAISKINPDRVQIGTLDRPGTEDWVKEADDKKMQEIANFLGNTELIGEFRSR